MWMKIGSALLGCAEDLLDEAPMLGGLQLISECTNLLVANKALGIKLGNIYCMPLAVCN